MYTLYCNELYTCLRTISLTKYIVLKGRETWKKNLFHSLYQLNGKIINYTFLNFLFHVLTIKQAIESVSGYLDTSSGQSGDVTRCTDSTEKMGKILIFC